MALEGFQETLGGSWKLLRNEKFDDYLGMMGIGFLKRKLACAFTTVVKLQTIDDDKIHIVSNGPKYSEDTCTVDKEFVESDPFDNSVKVKVTWDPTTKVMRTEAIPVDPKKGKHAIVERKIEANGEMLMEITLPNDNFVCKRFFKRDNS